MTAHANVGSWPVAAFGGERGKGDHKHLRGREMPYVWVSIEQLFADFWNDVKEIERDET